MTNLMTKQMPMQKVQEWTAHTIIKMRSLKELHEWMQSNRKKAYIWKKQQLN